MEPETIDLGGNMDLGSLRELNFSALIKVDFPNIGGYTFDDYRKNGYKHMLGLGYCISCEERSINQATDDPNYSLTNISHGSHTADFLESLKQHVDSSSWHKDPVMFIYETPSIDYGIYEEIEFAGHFKHPSKDWYWIHEDQEQVSYPQKFKGGEYGGFVLSAILTFQLANAYITNLVKCGMNNQEGKSKGIRYYKDECVRNCYEIFLSREIEIVNPKVIFAVGSAVERWLKHLVGDKYFIQQLPHPAGRRRGFRDEYYKVLYFWLVLRALHKTGVVQKSENFAEMFLNKF